MNALSVQRGKGLGKKAQGAGRIQRKGMGQLAFTV